MVFSPQTFLTARTHFCAFLLYIHHHQTLCSTRRGQGKYMDCLSNPPCEGMLQAFSMVRAVILGIFALVSCCAGQGGEHSWKLPPVGPQPVLGGGRAGEPRKLPHCLLGNSSCMFQFCWITRPGKKKKKKSGQNTHSYFQSHYNLSACHSLLSIQLRKDHIHTKSCSSFLTSSNMGRDSSGGRDFTWGAAVASRLISIPAAFTLTNRRHIS